MLIKIKGILSVWQEDMNLTTAEVREGFPLCLQSPKKDERSSKIKGEAVVYRKGKRK